MSDLFGSRSWTATEGGFSEAVPVHVLRQRLPHQSKLTRHILSHSLETLKYREQRQPHSLPLTKPEPLSFMDYCGRLSAISHEPPDPTDQPPLPWRWRSTKLRRPQPLEVRAAAWFSASSAANPFLTSARSSLICRCTLATDPSSASFAARLSSCATT